MTESRNTVRPGPAVVYTREILEAIAGHAVAGYPSETCGVVLVGAGPPQVRPMQNVYDRYHARDPERFPRTSRTAYLWDPKEQLALMEECERTGARIAAIWHSHCDAGAYFSAEDKAMAVVEGEPVMPGAEYLVVSVQGGKFKEAAVFRWDGSDFARADLRLPA